MIPFISPFFATVLLLGLYILYNSNIFNFIQWDFCLFQGLQQSVYKIDSYATTATVWDIGSLNYRKEFLEEFFIEECFANWFLYCKQTNQVTSSILFCVTVLRKQKILNKARFNNGEQIKLDTIDMFKIVDGCMLLHIYTTSKDGQIQHNQWIVCGCRLRLLLNLLNRSWAFDELTKCSIISKYRMCFFRITLNFNILCFRSYFVAEKSSFKRQALFFIKMCYLFSLQRKIN